MNIQHTFVVTSINGVRAVFIPIDILREGAIAKTQQKRK